MVAVVFQVDGRWMAMLMAGCCEVVAVVFQVVGRVLLGGCYALPTGCLGVAMQLLWCFS